VAQQLWFLRHGEAEPHDARPDEQRRLTQRGEQQSRAAGQALAALELTFQLTVTSPRVRSLDTARLACESLGCEPVVEQSLSGGFDADDAYEIAAALGPDKRMLLVGHNPDFEQVVCDLTGARIDLKKGGIAAVRLDGRQGTLIVLMRPREIARICGSPRDAQSS
jgi:phosphohistidine phosphatase